MESIERFVDLMNYDSVEDWRNQLLKLSNDLGYERTLLAIFPDRNTPVEAEFAFLHSNYSSAWRSKYDAEKMGYIDPTVSHCATKSIPLIWTPEIFSARKQQEMYEEACGHGLRSGVTLPIHGPNGELGMLCFVSSTNPDQAFKREAMRTLPQLSCFRDFIFESSLRHMNRKSAANPLVQLTQREVECLKWSAAGKSSWDIGQILNCTEATINYHFSNIRRKFSTTSRREAVVKAIALGLITLL